MTAVPLVGMKRAATLPEPATEFLSIHRRLHDGGAKVNRSVDVEVYHEILHRYTAIRRPAAIDAAFGSLDVLTDDVFTLASRRSARPEHFSMN